MNEMWCTCVEEPHTPPIGINKTTGSLLWLVTGLSMCVRQKQSRRKDHVWMWKQIFLLFFVLPGSTVKSDSHHEPIFFTAPTGSVIKLLMWSVCKELMLWEQNSFIFSNKIKSRKKVVWSCCMCVHRLKLVCSQTKVLLCWLYVHATFIWRS